ncbi:protein tiptop isoform X3 [Folsomia candida]|uniref:protein tiptop isoform X3 n=1 Tax=Folsomia candida TaxID=158441 RepID=UPI000B90A224|nr:protein tiptop isoform X3 [Folsomia candida]
MPRRKQNCPKRMKWELENAEGAARGEGGDKKPDGGKGEMSGGSDNDNDNDMGSDSDESVDNVPTTSSRESSPPSPRSSHSSSHKNGGASAILDFSRGPCGPPVSSPPSMISPLTTRKHNRGDNTGGGGGGGGGRGGMGDSPLDLSVSHKKPTKEDDGPLKKLPKWSPSSINDSTPTSTPLIANHHHHHQNRERKNSWNGNHSPDIKALEKMSEMSRGGGGGGAQDGVGGKLTSPSSGRGNSGSSSSWQAQWLAQNSTGTREIFKCVVCRSTFNTLAALSVHMKESKHGPPMPNLPSPKMPPQQSPQHPPVSTPTGGSSSSASDSSSLLLKGTGGGHKVLSPFAIAETVQLPRKLVRGQDVWLGKGAEQTRQILKCMWCGTSFRSLAEMTAHMQQTQHYTNIISQEQLISWRSSDDKSSSTNSHVSAVLTCKVCDQAFSSLKDLSNHMVKNQHYKEHIMRSITESGSRRRQSREKRKKSLPVRKLLELERASQEMKKEIRISCEKCSEKIPGPLFVEHLRVCGTTSHSHSGSGASSGGSSPLKQPTPSPKLDGHTGSHSGRESSGTGELDLSLGGSGGGGKDKSDSDNNKNEQSSAINAIEKMIEKSFDYRSAVRSQPSNIGPSPPIGSSILKRLGIDESVDYTKPLMEHSGLLPLPPSGKYSIPQSRRSRSRSASSDHSISEDLTHRSKSNSNSSSPALPSNDNDAGSLKSPLSLCNNNVRSNTKSPASDSLGGDHSTDLDGDAISDDNQSEHNSITAATNKRKHKAITNKSASSNNNHSKKSRQKQNSLSALSSMFESIGGSGGGASGSQGGRDGGDHNNSNSKNSSGFPSNSHHPLAALQKLCDKTENSPGNGTAGGGDREGGRGSVNSRPTSTSSSNPQSSPEPSLLGLNWAAAAANASAGDASDGNVFKCTFCDTPFLSKGAYRLHLAKMHFVKESSKSPHQDLNSANNKDGSGGGGGGANPSGVVEPTINSSDSPASKLMKYAELAKQLSSK